MLTLMSLLLWLALTGQQYEETQTALLLSLGALFVFWQHKSRLIPSLIPPDSKARHRPRPRPMSESAPQPERVPESSRLETIGTPEPRPPIPLPDEPGGD